MSNVKMNENQFLGKQELNRLKRFITTDGYKAVFKSIVANYGVVQLQEDVAFTSLMITEGDTAGYINLSAGHAIDADVNIIRVLEEQVDVLAIPDDNVQRKVVISYDVSNIEEGTIAIDVDGNLTGTGTKFLEVLRGAPHHPVKIRLVNSASNVQEYIVRLVNNDTSAMIQGASFTAETDLTYRVVGTFINGVAIPSPNKNIYEFDHFQISLQDMAYVPNEGYEFVLALVTYDSPDLTIVDQRPFNQFELFLPTETSVISVNGAAPLIGYESVQYDSVISNKEHNIVRLGWGFRSQSGQWVADPANNKITINVGLGGRYRLAVDVPDEAFEGWRLYFNNDRYIKVLTSELVAGSIELTLDDYNEVLHPINGEITIVPNANFIQFMHVYSLPDVDRPNIGQKFLFPIRKGFGDCRVKVGSVNDRFDYQLELNGTYNNPLIGGGPGGADNDYYNFTAFDQHGLQINNNSSTATGGNFNNSIHPSLNHHAFKAWLNQSNDWQAGFTNTYNGIQISAFLARYTGNMEITPFIEEAFVSPGGGTYDGFQEYTSVIFETTGGATITGLSGPTSGKLAILRNSLNSTADIVLAHNGSGTSAFSMFMPSQVRTVLRPGQCAAFLYSPNVSRWEYVFGNADASEKWHTLGTAPEPVFQNLYTGGAGAEAVKYRIDSSGMVHLKGILNATAVLGTNDVAFQLPIGYRPMTSTPSVGGMVVKSNGVSPVATHRLAYITGGGDFVVYLVGGADVLDVLNLASFPPFFAEA